MAGYGERKAAACLAGLSAALLVAAPVLAAAPVPVLPPDAFAQAMAREIVGVVGSPRGLVLRVKVGEALRDLAIGAIYKDGWRLTRLTPVEAVLARAGEVKHVGLNPSGAAPDPYARPVIAQSASLSREELDAAVRDGQALHLLRHGGEGRQVRMALRQSLIGQGGPETVNTLRRLDGLEPLGPDRILAPSDMIAAFRSQGAMAASIPGFMGLAGYYPVPNGDGTATYYRGRRDYLANGGEAMEAAFEEAFADAGLIYTAYVPRGY